jgi:hypothetical protein
MAAAECPVTRVLRLPELRGPVFEHLDVPSLAAVVRVNKAWFAAGAPLLWRNATVSGLRAVAPARIPIYDNAVVSLDINVMPGSVGTEMQSPPPPFDDAWRLPHLTKLHCEYVSALSALVIAVPVVQRCAATLKVVVFDESLMLLMMGERTKRADLAAVRRRNRDSAFWAALARCKRLSKLCLIMPLTDAAVEQARAAIVRDGGARPPPFFAPLTRFEGQVKTEAVPALCALLPNLTHLRLAVDECVIPFPIHALLARLPRLQVLALLGDMQTTAPDYADVSDKDFEGDPDTTHAPNMRKLYMQFPELDRTFSGTATPRQFLRALLPKMPALQELDLAYSDSVPQSIFMLVGELATNLVTLAFGVTLNLLPLASATTCPLFPKLRKLKAADLKEKGDIIETETIDK